MSHSGRRKFLRSLSRTALVLPFADILALAAQQQEVPQRTKKEDWPYRTQLRRQARSSSAGSEISD